MRDVRTDHIQGFYNQLVNQKIGVPTIRKIHKLLRSAFGDAEETGMIGRNPVANAHPPREQESEIRILDENQIGLFLESIDGHKWEPLFFLEIMTGMRRGELLALQWEDLDWLKKTIRIDKQLSKTPNTEMMFQPLKTKSSKRTIDLNENSIQVLKSHYEHQQLQRLAAGEKWIEHGLIFTNSKGGPVNAGHITKVFHDLIGASGLPVMKFHGLRHTHATTLLGKKIPTLVVSRRLGHSRPSTTLDVYGHIVDGMSSEVSKILDELVPIKLHPNCTQLHLPGQFAIENDEFEPNIKH